MTTAPQTTLVRPSQVHGRSWSMSIRTRPGEFVRFCHPTAGYPGEGEKALDHLRIGDVYQVADIEVGGWHTTVELVEVPGKRFNSVLFADAPEVEARP